MMILSGGGLLGAISSLLMSLISSRKVQNLKIKTDESEIEILAAGKDEIKKMLDGVNNETNPLEPAPDRNREPDNNFNHFLKYLGIQKRYYDTNLTQTRAVFFIGITLLFIGVVMISVGVIMGLSSNTPNALTLVLTFVSGILIDFLGTIFVSIHTKTLETAAVYQKSISRVSNTLLAKSIVDNLDDKNLRQQALIEIAKELSKT